MCGIAGFIDFNKKSDLIVLKNMIGVLGHRGPDDSGVKVIDNVNANIGLAQARLSIIDLTNAGHQPMVYKDLTIIFNGEIYNYKEIKSQLVAIGHQFQSNSDTEVILHAIDEWGEKAVEKFIGMFVYLIYNHTKDTVSITRDRAGIKPLYYYYKNNTFLFGSELKALFEHSNFKKEIAIEVLPNYFQYGFISAPYTIFNDCFKINPGSHLNIDLKTKAIEEVNYWNVDHYYQLPKLDISYQQAKDEIHKLLKSACSYRMIADVPVGVFLSGGYDSTAITAILQNSQSEKLKTFTIGFEGVKNEAVFAKETATLLGTDHTELYCTENDAKSIIPELSYFFDEPFADSSAIPTILVSKLAKQKVTVALSADAGDEIFCGYNDYINLMNYNQKLNKVPSFLFKPIQIFGGFIQAINVILPLSFSQKLFGFTNSLDKNPQKQLSKLFQSMNEMPQDYVNKLFKERIASVESPYSVNKKEITDPRELALALDYNNYLQNDILTKVDRATMSVSLEGREPLLDHRLIEFAAQLPFEYKFDNKIGKKILKEIVHEYVPKEMMDRPKVGFSLPIYKWLKGDLSYLMDKYLSKEALEWSGILNVNFILKEVQSFKNDKLHYKPLIWKILVYQMWYERWILNEKSTS